MKKSRAKISKQKAPKEYSFRGGIKGKYLMRFSLENGVTYVNRIRKKSRHQSDEEFFKEIIEWQKADREQP
ncbi:MAG: hypothetical protein AB1515_01740 [Nitrospirota bacterium]